MFSLFTVTYEVYRECIRNEYKKQMIQWKRAQFSFLLQFPLLQNTSIILLSKIILRVYCGECVIIQAEVTKIPSI